MSGIVEPFAEDRLEDNFNPVGHIFYSASTTICLPSGGGGSAGVVLCRLPPTWDHPEGGEFKGSLQRLGGSTTVVDLTEEVARAQENQSRA